MKVLLRGRRALVVIVASIMFVAGSSMVPVAQAASSPPEFAIGSTHTNLGNLNSLLGVADGTSGIAYSRKNPGVLWLLTDQRARTNGGLQSLFAIDPISWRVISAYTVTNPNGTPASWVDFEDMAMGADENGNTYIYMYENRNPLNHVLRVPEPTVSTSDPSNSQNTVAYDRNIQLTFPNNAVPDIETIALDTANDTLLLVARTRSSNCTIASNDNPLNTWRVESFSTLADTVSSTPVTSTTGLVGRPGQSPNSAHNMVGGGDMSPDGYVFAMNTTPKVGCPNTSAYVTLRYRMPDQTWAQALSSQVQLPVADSRVRLTSNAEAFAFKPDMTHMVYAPEFGGSGGNLYLRSLAYTPPQGDTTPPPDPDPEPGELTLTGAGDIADCTSNGDELTANLLDDLPGALFTLGDNAYNLGSEANFSNCFEPTWGRHRARIRPAIGNHEYNTPNATPYFNYFGAAAGDADKGYYSYDIGEDWHVVVLNTNCTIVSCVVGSAQYTWLQGVLEANGDRNVISMMHHPRFSSGQHGSSNSVAALWDLQYDYGVDLVLAGHEHNYERFARVDKSGNPDNEHGMRLIVIGTGGVALRDMAPSPLPITDVRDNTSWGVMKFTLRSDSYDWQFFPVAGASFTDNGTSVVHDAPTGTPPPPPPPPSDPVTIVAYQDARVESANLNSNYGNGNTLASDGSPLVSSYIGFDLSTLAGRNITSAKLRIYVKDRSPHDQFVKSVASAWLESNITWNNRPAAGSTIGTFLGAAEVGTWIEADITAAVAASAGSSNFSVVFDQTGGDGLYVHSTEGTAGLLPQLVVE